jgi:hypothetical protein
VVGVVFVEHGRAGLFAGEVDEGGLHVGGAELGRGGPTLQPPG